MLSIPISITLKIVILNEGKVVCKCDNMLILFLFDALVTSKGISGSAPTGDRQHTLVATLSSQLERTKSIFSNITGSLGRECLLTQGYRW